VLLLALLVVLPIDVFPTPVVFCNRAENIYWL